ncbi:MAG: cysteine desulfurase [Trichodesmium sp. MAG_R03]|nr:cysteine desulfurase [Trichodesmium sp. MAG_R03]
MQIYLDHSATTPTRPEVITTMQQVLTQQWGNPSSLHKWGKRSATLVERARIKVANLMNTVPESIIFTSGGTEADNMAIMGVARCYEKPQHIIISSVEHSAISEPARMLENWGWQVTRLPVDRQGRVDSQELQAALQMNTVLVSIIYGQSEVGTLQPIVELGNICRYRGVLFHTDAVQVVGHLPVDVQKLPVDLLSLSSHKIYGPQGVGALYIRQGVELVPLLSGGGQEMKLRSGTQAVAAIAGFGVAAEFANEEITTETSRLSRLRDRLFAQMLDNPYVICTGDQLYRLPHHVSFCIVPPEGKAKADDQVTGKTVVRQLNLAGIGISTGSACHSGKISPSPILLAMGYTKDISIRGIRLTLGRETTEADIDWTAMVLKQILARLMSNTNSQKFYCLSL